ncbi:translation initiation factor IF-2 N-terminal domain-containing protein, partial [Klebsiella pneumoniae]|uniref:translation initiation factor IF-2 N-terminal domain-containing protein n=1 Tax=Klebsiella pneumoniae TaxID=573 RepID=UPI00351CB999
MPRARTGSIRSEQNWGHGLRRVYMSDMTVKDFAAKVGRDVPRLLEQMKEAGLKHKSEGDAVSEEDKRQLLDYLTKSHGGDA